MDEIDFTDGPYLALNSTTTTMTPDEQRQGTGFAVSLTASANAFVSTDVGRLINFSNGYAKITGFVINNHVVTITVKSDFDNTTATADWKLGAFSDTTGHPSCVSFYEQRLVFAGTS